VTTESASTLTVPTGASALRDTNWTLLAKSASVRHFSQLTCFIKTIKMQFKNPEFLKKIK